MLEFEWSQEKAEQNLRKHGAGFPEAAEVFLDPYRLEVADAKSTCGEERFDVIGASGARLLSVVYTERFGLYPADLCQARDPARGANLHGAVPQMAMRRFRLDSAKVRKRPRKSERPPSESRVEAAAASDHDCRPLTDAQLRRIRRVPFVKHVRLLLGLSQRAFAGRFAIPLGTLRDWEQGRSRPDRAALLCLRLILRYPREATRIAREMEAAG